MSAYRNNYDVSERIDVTDPSAVNAEVDRIFLDLYPGASTSRIDQSFQDMDALYHGRFPGYHACDTEYHDIHHALDVTLAMARLMAGYERDMVGPEPFGASLFCLGIVTALFHDSGYVRELADTVHRNGAEFTLTHVSRGARFLKAYLPGIGMGEMADIAAMLNHFTGHEMPIAQIKVPTLRHKLLGNLLGSADIIAQMSDRCYLEKCRDRLYPEFLVGGVARKRLASGAEEVVYESGADLVMKMPKFYEDSKQRLEKDLQGGYRYVEPGCGGPEIYLRKIDKNVRFAQAMSQVQDTSALKRTLPHAK